MLKSQRLEEGGSHDPSQFVQPGNINCERIILHQAPIWPLVLLHDGEVALVGQFLAVGRFAVCHIAHAMFLDDLDWHAQLDSAIDVPAPLGRRECVIGMAGCDLISEEAGCTGTCMGDQGLFLTQFQLEGVSQELFQALPYLLRFCLWSCKAEQKVVRIAHISQASIVRIKGVARWKFPSLSFQRGDLPALSLLVFEASYPMFELAVGGVPGSLFLAVVRWKEHRFDKVIELMQVDVGKDGTHDSALWRATERAVIFPFFQVACLEQPFQQSDEPRIVEVFFQDGQQDVMVNVESRWSACAGFAASRFLHRAPSN